MISFLNKLNLSRRIKELSKLSIPRLFFNMIIIYHYKNKINFELIKFYPSYLIQLPLNY